MTQHEPTWPKVDFHILIFDIKTIGFLMILNNQFFRVLSLLGIHLRPCEPLGLTLGSPWAPFGVILGPLEVPRGPLGLLLGPSWRTMTSLWAHLGAPRVHLAPSEAF